MDRIATAEQAYMQYAQMLIMLEKKPVPPTYAAALGTIHATDRDFVSRDPWMAENILRMETVTARSAQLLQSIDSIGRKMSMNVLRLLMSDKRQYRKWKDQIHRKAIGLYVYNSKENDSDIIWDTEEELEALAEQQAVVLGMHANIRQCREPIITLLKNSPPATRTDVQRLQRISDNFAYLDSQWPIHEADTEIDPEFQRGQDKNIREGKNAFAALPLPARIRCAFHINVGKRSKSFWSVVNRHCSRIPQEFFEATRKLPSVIDTHTVLMPRLNRLENVEKFARCAEIVQSFR